MSASTSWLGYAASAVKRHALNVSNGGIRGTITVWYLVLSLIYIQQQCQQPILQPYGYKICRSIDDGFASV